MKTNVIQAHKFKEILEQATLDPKNRLSIGKAVLSSRIFKVYRNAAGQILLDPQILIPEREAWIYQNPKLIQAIDKGIDQAKKGKLKKLGSFRKYLTDSSENA